jgi:hypothetical protein
MVTVLQIALWAKGASIAVLLAISEPCRPLI